MFNCVINEYVNLDQFCWDGDVWLAVFEPLEQPLQRGTLTGEIYNEDGIWCGFYCESDNYIHHDLDRRMIIGHIDENGSITLRFKEKLEYFLKVNYRFTELEEETIHNWKEEGF